MINATTETTPLVQPDTAYVLPALSTHLLETLAVSLHEKVMAENAEGKMVVVHRYYEGDNAWYSCTFTPMKKPGVQRRSYHEDVLSLLFLDAQVDAETGWCTLEVVNG